MGKGFGYVNFTSKDAVVLALEKNGQMLKNREIRIKPYKYNEEPSNNKIKTEKSKHSATKKKQQQKSSSDGFQGELGVKKSKKLVKKSMKNRLNASRIKKQKKTIAQIMNKK